MLSADYRAMGRKLLDGRWWQAVMIGLVAAILGDGLHTDSRIDISADEGISFSNIYTPEEGITLFKNIDSVLGFLFGTAVILGIVYAILSVTIGMVVRVGKADYYMKVYRGENQNAFSTLFHPFKYWGTCLAMGVLSFIKTFLWSLLLIVPGIMAAFSYSMAPYILAENPGFTASEAIARSVEMMRGNRWRLFCLQVSFIGWSLLSAITMNIGYLFLNPYIDASKTAFYMDLRGRNYSF